MRKPHSSLCACTFAAPELPSRRWEARPPIPRDRGVAPMRRARASSQSKGDILTEFGKIGVVGAGMMGSEIALMFALSGRPTLLSDVSPDAAKRAIERLHGVLDRGLPRGFWSETAAETARRWFSAADRLEGYENCDLVIEAVFENEDLKRDIFRKLDAILAPEAGLASNTSSI